MKHHSRSDYNTVSGGSESRGLVLCDKNDRKDKRYYSLLLYADVAELRSTSPDQKRDIRKTSPGTRKEITSFTRKSRNNMLLQLAKARNTDRGLFISLTYPDTVAFMPSFDRTTIKRDIATLRKRIERKFPNAWALWRLEFQRRKSGRFEGELAPHFHLLLFGVLDDLAELRRWLRAAWYEIAHAGDEHQGRAAIQIDTMKNRRHAVTYAAKYAAKINSDDDNLSDWIGGKLPGRWWSIFGAIDQEPAYHVVLDYESFVRMKRVVRGWLKHRNRRYCEKIHNLRDTFSMFVFGLGDLSEGQQKRDRPPPLIRAVDLVNFLQEV